MVDQADKYNRNEQSLSSPAKNAQAPNATKSTDLFTSDNIANDRRENNNQRLIRRTSITNVAFVIFGFTGWLISSWLVTSIEPARLDKLSVDLTYNYVSATVWFHSRGKLRELETILREDYTDKRELERRITNMLKHRTSNYLREFNNLDAPIHHLGNEYEQLFEFDDFLGAVFDIVNRSDLSVDDKIARVADVMEFYQSRANNALRNKMAENGDRL